MSGRGGLKQLEAKNRTVGMVEAGKTVRDAAAAVGVTHSAVVKWMKKIKTKKPLSDLPRSGRPSKASKVVKMVLTKSLAKKNHSTRKLASRLSSRGHQISKSTVNRYLVNHLGARAYVQRKVPKITKAQEIKRLRFCKERKNWTSEDWKDVIFSDESPYELYATPNRKKLCFLGEEKGRCALC